MVTSHSLIVAPYSLTMTSHSLTVAPYSLTIASHSLTMTSHPTHYMPTSTNAPILKVTEGRAPSTLATPVGWVLVWKWVQVTAEQRDVGYNSLKLHHLY